MAISPSKEISVLLEIMARLRDRENGCAWDVEQTYETIAPYTIEEAYEVADAIERKDYEDLKDELGDLLLQPVFHAQIASELGHFSFEDVVEAITTKLVRRHPHVFGPKEFRSREMAKGQWAQIKAEEKAERAEKRKNAGVEGANSSGTFSNIPNNAPALLQAIKIQKEVARYGFDWKDLSPVIDKIHEEIDEVMEQIKSGSAKGQKDEIGDLLYAVINLARHLNVDPDSALRGTNQKFMKRFNRMDEELKNDGKTLNDIKLEEMEELWQKVKRFERK